MAKSGSSATSSRPPWPLLLTAGTPVSVVFGRPLAPADYDDPKAGKDRSQIASERIMAAIALLQLPPETIV